MWTTRISRAMILVIGLFYLCEATAHSQTITIDIPQKVPLTSGPVSVTSPPAYEKMQILKVVTWLSVDPVNAAKPVTFQIKDLTGTMQTWGPVTLTQGGASLTHCFPQGAMCNSQSDDHVTIVPPPGSDNRYQIVFNLLSNSDMNCVSTQSTSTDKFQITATFNGAAPDPPFIGFCSESFDTVNRPQNTISSCFATAVNAKSVPPAECHDSTPARCVASVEGQQISACGRQRPGVDAVLVLDESGSMSTVENGQSRIQKLKDAVASLTQTWTNLPPPETIPTVSDSIAAIPFHAQQESEIGPVDPTTTDIAGTVNASLNATGSTSIGAGLGAAAPLVTSPGNARPVMLLMSDGQQNTDPWVEIDPTSNRVALYCLNPAALNVLCHSDTIPPRGCTQTNPCDLRGQPPTQIYTVTIGPDYLGPINQAIAQKANGFYLNVLATADTNLLVPYFQELLQNFLKFNSYETVRIISEKTPYSATIPVSTTSRNVEFSLAWPSKLGALQMSITPPGGGAPIVRESGSGFISIFQNLPLGVPFDPMGDWKINVTALNIDPTTTSQNGIPFNFHAMTDDASIKTDLAVVPADYATGDQILLRAKLTQFGTPLLSIGTHPGDKIEVTPVKPGQSLGDVLSDSTASAMSTGSDVQPGFEAKLFNTLQTNPLLQKTEPTIKLFDDGKPEHGDETAGDGIYSARYLPVVPGTYEFLFSAESTDPNSVRFSRQQIRTAYVRPIPDGANSIFRTSIVRRDRGGVLTITMTPRFKPGPGCSKSDTHCGRMGPGFGPYFWFTAPGQTPVRAKDSPNLDGTYAASMSFTGTPPPQVSFHFLRVLTVISDSVTTSNELPVSLGPENIVVNNIFPGTNHLAAFFDIGPNFPHGSFGSAFNTGVSLNAGLEYIAHPHISLEGIFGYHHFPGSLVGDLNVYQFSANGKSYLTNGNVRPFVNGGIGGYKFSPGSTYFGGNVGGGVLYTLTQRFGLQLSYNFHVVNTGPATKFSDVQFGVRWVF